jgi:hypothetical protein
VMTDTQRQQATFRLLIAAATLMLASALFL